VERLGGIFSGFSEEGVGGGVAEEIAFDDLWLNGFSIIKILRICIDEIK
jgi:hypothetical protein